MLEKVSGFLRKKMCTKIVFIIAVVIFAISATAGVSEIFIDEEIAFAKMLNPDGNKNVILLFFTHLGAAYCVIPVAAAFLLLPKRKSLALPIAVTITSSWLLNTAVKNIVCRARPVGKLLQETSFSFPSGHAMNNMALYSAIIICLLPFCKTKGQKAAVWSISVLPLLIGISRVYFNVHYISDVVAGWSLGLIVSILCCGIILKMGCSGDCKNKI